MSHTTNAETAYAAVKERILDGTLPGGELVSENQLASELGMSRTPVREAFLRLETEGLMRLYAKRGALVVPVAEGEARDVLRARHLVEVDAVEQIGVRDETAPGPGAGGLRERLEEAMAAQEAAAAAGDTGAFSAADAEFHRAVVDAGGNAVLAVFYRGIGDRQRRMTTHAARRSPERVAAILTEHRELADLACAGDAAGYAAALWRHMSLTHSLPASQMPASQMPASHLPATDPSGATR